MTQSSEIAGVVRIEEQLAAALVTTSINIEHVDCLDEEQRSEIYTILHALRSDNEQHRQIVGQWVSDRPKGN
jgi:hypothetical protein